MYVYTYMFVCWSVESAIITTHICNQQRRHMLLVFELESRKLRAPNFSSQLCT